MRRISHTVRLAVFFLALLAPALAMYPSLLAHATESKERLIATTFGPQAASLREDLQRRLQQAVEQIDVIPALDELVRLDLSTPAADPARAFAVWSRTDLAIYRLTSAVEVYSADGQLVSAFRLSLPEYVTTEYRSPGCSWDEPFDEVSAFGSSERHVLRIARGVCVRGRMVGSIVVRVMLDYRTLPFISTESPYLESLQPDRVARSEGASGRDVEFAMYGWSRAPIIETGSTVWELPDRVFNRLVQSRQPFWDTLQRGDETFRAYLLSDRGEIYALAGGEFQVAGDVVGRRPAGNPGDQAGQPDVADDAGDRGVVGGGLTFVHGPDQDPLHRRGHGVDLGCRARVGEHEGPGHRLGQQRVALHGPGHPAEHEDHPLVGRVPGDAGPVQLLLGPLELPGQTGHQQVDLGREVPVQGAQGDVGLLGHGPHLHRFVAALGGQRQRGVQDPLAPLALRRRTQLGVAGCAQRIGSTCSRWCHTGSLIVSVRNKTIKHTGADYWHGLAAYRWNVF
jgi:hypothetical protein